jgi:hypothetical protein
MWLREIRYEDVDASNLLQDRNQWKTFVNVVMTLRVPKRTRNLMVNLGTISF